MRQGCGNKTGLEYIHEAIEKLSEKHAEHMEVYGLHNDERMSGAHETADYHTFSSGIANRGASVRIGNDVSRYISFYYIDKKGWGFDNDNLTSDKLKTMIDNGAEFLYSDSRKVDSSNLITTHLDELILKKGSIKVFRLKH